MAKHRRTRGQSNLYVYGIVPADVHVAEDVQGVGDPPGHVTVIREGDIAALVSPVTPNGRPLGTPEDLTAYASLLDATATELPVLPIRFGAVLRDETAVRTELLAEHHDDFAAALEDLDGKAQYVVKARYQQDAVLREVLAENPDAARLRERIRGVSEDAGRQDRIALGELIEQAIAGKRAHDTEQVVHALDGHALRISVREPTHEHDAAHVAFLAEIARQGDLEEAVGRLADEGSGRVDVRLLGPLAAYDFVITTQGQEA